MLRTNNKKVKEQLKRDVLAAFTKDSGWSSNNAIANLREQIDAMRYGNRTIYATALDYVEGGSYLIYYHDVQEYLKDLLESNRNYSDDKAWRLYCHLFARTISQIYTEGEV